MQGVVDSTGALSFDEIPGSLCIIGGGVIGIEMAHIYSSLGSKVTIVEMLPDILMNMDSDITAVMRKIMKKNKSIHPHRNEGRRHRRGRRSSVGKGYR